MLAFPPRQSTSDIYATLSPIIILLLGSYSSTSPSSEFRRVPAALYPATIPAIGLPAITLVLSIGQTVTNDPLSKVTI